MSKESNPCPAGCNGEVKHSLISYANDSSMGTSHTVCMECGFSAPDRVWNTRRTPPGYKLMPTTPAQKQLDAMLEEYHLGADMREIYMAAIENADYE